MADYSGAYEPPTQFDKGTVRVTAPKTLLLGGINPPYLMRGEDTLVRREVTSDGLFNIYKRPDGSTYAIPAISPTGSAEDSYTPERTRALKEADNAINGDRQQDYGPPEVNFRRAAMIWKELFPERDWTPADIALALAGVKLARAAEGYTRDTYVDLAGYAALAVELNEKEDE